MLLLALLTMVKLNPFLPRFNWLIIRLFIETWHLHTVLVEISGCLAGYWLYFFFYNERFRLTLVYFTEIITVILIISECKSSISNIDKIISNIYFILQYWLPIIRHLCIDLKVNIILKSCNIEDHQKHQVYKCRQGTYELYSKNGI